jgi:D-alanyl-D-alanine carboxypeptidase
LVCAAEREKKVIIVVLLGSPSRENLWREAERLIVKGFEKMEYQRVQYSGETI